MNSYSSVKNNILKFVHKCLKLEKIILSEVIQTQKYRDDMYSFMHGY